MADTCYGLVRTRTDASGATTWRLTTDPADMLKGDYEYIPAGSWTEGLATLRDRHPVPAAAADIASRVFSPTGRTGRAVALPCPMLLALSDPKTDPAARADELLRLLTDPLSGGALWLPTPGALARLCDVTYYRFSQTEFVPDLTAGYTRRRTTPDAYAKFIRTSDAFLTRNLVVGQVTLAAGSRVLTVRVDPKAVLVRARAAATRARTAERRRFEAEEADRKEAADRAERARVAAAWRGLTQAAESLWGDVPDLAPFQLAWRYPHRTSTHPAARFRTVVAVHERLVGRRRWRTSTAARNALLAVHDVRPLVGTPLDPEAGSDAQGLAALTWLWVEVDRVRREQRRASRRAEAAASA